MKQLLAPEENEALGEAARQETLSPAVWVLVAVGAICLIAGVLYLTEITAGVGGIAAACFFGIVARVVQAHAHHKELMKR